MAQETLLVGSTALGQGASTGLSAARSLRPSALYREERHVSYSAVYEGDAVFRHWKRSTFASGWPFSYNIDLCLNLNGPLSWRRLLPDT